MANPRVLNGIHVSNHPNRFVEEMAQVTRPTGAAVIMHQLMFGADEMTGDYGDAENDYWMKLRYGLERQGIAPAPERLLIVRIWHRNDPFQFDPKVRAEYIVRLLERWRAHGYPDHNLLDDGFVAVQATNETNIEPASSLALPPTERYDRAARWESAFWDAFDKAAPGRKCLSCGPNLAFGHDWLDDQPDSEYDHPGIRELCHRHIETGGLLGIHVYYHGHRPWERGGPGQDNQYWYWFRPFRPDGYRDALEPSRPHDRGGIVARFPEALFAVSEAGTWRHSDPNGTAETVDAVRQFMQHAAESGRFVAFCPFIWDTNPASHPQNIIADNATLRRGLVELPDFAARAALPIARPGWSPAPAPTPPPTPVPPGWAPVRTSALLDAVEARSGEGWAQLAGRAAGHPEAPYGIRRQWALEIVAANGLSPEAIGDPSLPHPGALYKVPSAWFAAGEP